MAIFDLIAETHRGQSIGLHRPFSSGRLSRMPTTAKHFTTPIWTVWSMR